MAARQRPIEIEYLAKVTDYLRNVEKVEISTEQVEAALVATSSSAKDLERKLSKAMRDAAKDVEVLERAVKDLPKATDDAADDAVRDFDRIGDEAVESGKDAGKNFAQSLGEGLSSGDPSEVMQEVLGEAIGEVSGPASAAVAGMAALALVLWNHFKEESEKHRQDVAEQFDLIDEITGAIDRTAQITAAFTEIGGGDLQVGLEKARDLATDLGVEVGDVGAALTGEVNPATDELVGYLEEVVQGYRDGKDITYEQKDAAEELLDVIGKERDAYKDANENRKTWLQSQQGDLDAVHDKTQKVIDDIDKLTSSKKVINIEVHAMGSGVPLITGSGQLPTTSSYTSTAQRAKQKYPPPP